MAEGGSYSGNHDDDDKFDDNSHDDERPDAIKKVEKETTLIFTDFLYRRLKSRNGFEDSDMAVANIPPLQSLDDFNEDFNSDDNNKEQFEQLGKQLAQFGDVIEDRYKSVFANLISNLNLADDSDFGFDKFCSLAQRLFQDGINWGRIVALLCFGYQIAVTVIKRGKREIQLFLKKIVTWVVKFLLKEEIIAWILEQGGWVVGFVSALGDPTQNSSETWLKRIGALAVLAAVGYGCYRYLNQGKS